MSVEYGVFARLVTRCKETAREAGAPQVLTAVYEAASEQPFARFLGAMNMVEEATTRASHATTEVERALDKMDRQFRIGRSTVAAVLPDTTLPDTLKRQPTDTDKKTAIQRLVDLITPHAGQPWADALLQGDFGAKAAETLQRLSQAIEAQNALQKARTERSRSFQVAWDAYVSFKRLVRDTLGATARQYRRIHLRGASPAEEETTANAKEMTANAKAETTANAKEMTASAKEMTANAKEETTADTAPTPPPSMPAPARAARPARPAPSQAQAQARARAPINDSRPAIPALSVEEAVMVRAALRQRTEIPVDLPRGACREAPGVVIVVLAARRPQPHHDPG